MCEFPPNNSPQYTYHIEPNGVETHIAPYLTLEMQQDKISNTIKFGGDDSARRIDYFALYIRWVLNFKFIRRSDVFFF